MKEKLADSIMLGMIPLVASIAIRLTGRTWRYSILHQDGLVEARKQGKPVIYALWHGRMLLPLHFHRDQFICALVSHHRDGELANRIACRLGYLTARGSSTRGGARGFNEMLKEIRSGRDAAILPDGPRGPACQVQPGVLHLARHSGSPVVPISAGASSFFTLRSWDRFLIPKPFARCVIVYGRPLLVPADSSPNLVEEKRLELECSLNQISLEADSFFSTESRLRSIQKAVDGI